MPPRNAFLEFLESAGLGQQAAFFGMLPENLTRGQESFAQSLFPRTQNRFAGALGRQILGGEDPTLTFTDFLRNNLNFGQEFRRAPTSQSGLGRGGLTSQARFLFG